MENYRPGYAYLYSLKGSVSIYKILSPHQHGFQSEKSISIAMISLYNNIFKFLGKG